VFRRVVFRFVFFFFFFTDEMLYISNDATPQHSRQGGMHDEAGG